ncbi:uncharacterized protein LOC120536101 isoform X2 [Polypterus senegalus]|nr:uncharacterized protein LOC120536101 isoform X2 [Polypterus senegalus]XP_039620413.1 uncharacterized protein LOC120536101 isoform X2 [Polypterus senegalus]
MSMRKRLCAFVLFFVIFYSYKQSTVVMPYFKHFFHHWHPPVTHTKVSNSLIVLTYFNENITPPVTILSEDVIHIIAITKLVGHEEYRCHIGCNRTLFSMDAQAKIRFVNYILPYRLMDLYCQNPCGSAAILSRVTAWAHGQRVASELPAAFRAIAKRHPQRDFTACISAFSNYDGALLIQYVEMFQHLGAEKIFLYLSEMSKETQDVLAELNHKGYVEVIHWRVGFIFTQSNGKDFQRDVQVEAWSDCFYRNMHDTRSLAFSVAEPIGLFSNAWWGLHQFFRKENFNFSTLDLKDCEKYMTQDQKDQSPKGTDTLLAYVSLAAEPATYVRTSRLAQCLNEGPHREQVMFISARIPGKVFPAQKTPTLVTPIRDARAFVLSAFYDDRHQEDLIRIIGIVKRDYYENQGGRLYCHVLCPSGIYVEPVRTEIHVDHFDFPYGTASLICRNPCGSAILTNVTLSTSSESRSPGVTLKIQNTKESRPPKPQHDFTVCICTMFGNFDNALQLTQTLEMYRLLGAGKVVIYKTSCSDQVQEVLDYYAKEGFVQVFEWTVNLYLNPSSSWSYALHKADLHYHGQIAALNDCLYRNMYSSSYLVLIDQDEIIVPYKHDNWRDLIEALRKATPSANIFRFTNRIFPTDTYGKDPGALQWNDIPGVNILEFVNRETKIESYDPKKMIVDPRIAYKASVHYLMEHIGSEKEVDEHDALLFHCKEHKVISEPLNDVRIARYDAQLRINLNQVLSKTLRRSYPLVVTPVGSTNIFIISAFYDNRIINGQPLDVIHIIGIVKRDQFENQQETLHCHIECESVIYYHDVHVHLYKDHNGFPYGSADFLCKNPCGSAALIRVAVSTSDSRSSTDGYLYVHTSKAAQHTEPQRDFTVCISTMAGNYDDVLQLVLSIEMYRLLGADKVFIYKTNCSSMVQKVLDYYTAEGFLVVFNWTVDSYLKSSEIFNHGQNTALHDCIYRNMYTSRYLVLSDLGEILLPYKHETWGDLLKSLRSENSRPRIFAFTSYMFYHTSNQEVSGGSEWEDITGVNILHHVYREKQGKGSESKKIIVDPQMVQEVFIPELLQSSKEMMEVDKDNALWFHCNDHKTSLKVSYDPRILNYESKLKENVNTVLRKTVRR